MYLFVVLCMMQKRRNQLINKENIMSKKCRKEAKGSGPAQEAADAPVRDNRRGHRVYGRVESVQNILVRAPARKRLEKILQAGLEFQQDIPLRPRGAETHPRHRQHIRKG